VKPVRVESLYSRAGEWFAWACVTMGAVLLLIGRRRAYS
jgi:hypothetical protein